MKAPRGGKAQGPSVGERTKGPEGLSLKWSFLEAASADHNYPSMKEKLREKKAELGEQDEGRGHRNQHQKNGEREKLSHLCPTKSETGSLFLFHLPAILHTQPPADFHSERRSLSTSQTWEGSCPGGAESLEV